MSLAASLHECSNHPGVPAKHLCHVCAAPVCGDCCTEQGGLVTCREASHRETASNLVLFGRCADLFAADLVVRNLAAAGVECRRFDPREHGVEEPVRLFCLPAVTPRALETLSSLDLSDFLMRDHHAR